MIVVAILLDKILMLSSNARDDYIFWYVGIWEIQRKTSG